MKQYRKIVMFAATFVLLGLSSLYAEYPDPEFVTEDQHIDGIKKQLREKGETFKFLQSLQDRKDYDGDGIKDISILTDKDNIYFVSSIDIREKKSTDKTWIWYKVEEQ